MCKFRLIKHSKIYQQLCIFFTYTTILLGGWRPDDGVKRIVIIEHLTKKKIHLFITYIQTLDKMKDVNLVKWLLFTLHKKNDSKIKLIIPISDVLFCYLKTKQYTKSNK